MLIYKIYMHWYANSRNNRPIVIRQPDLRRFSRHRHERKSTKSYKGFLRNNAYEQRRPKRTVAPRHQQVYQQVKMPIQTRSTSDEKRKLGWCVVRTCKPMTGELYSLGNFRLRRAVESIKPLTLEHCDAQL